MPPILTLKDVEISFGEHPLFEGVALSILRGERACLVGRNGSGKSTLLKVIAGEIELDGGNRYVEPGLDISYLQQEPDYSAEQNVTGYIEEGLSPEKKTTHQYRIRDLIGEMRLNGATMMDAQSGGEKRRAAIARALVSDPDLLLLDEPTNHLDIQTVDWLENALARNPAAILTISHDRTFLRNMSSKSYWMDRGTLRVNDRGYADFERWSDGVFRAEERARDKLKKRIAAESDWLIHGVTARRKRNQGRLRELEKMRQLRVKHMTASSRLSARASLALEEGTPASRRVLEAHKISKSFGDNVIVENFSTRIMRGDRVAIVGPNGAGKTTLMRLLTGELEPDNGRVRFGNNLERLYFDQERESLNPKYTLWETLTDKEHGGSGDSVHVQGRTRHVVAYLKDFLFSDEQARQPVSSLSGGEKNRLLLAKAFTKPSNLLIMDEPTNDLDMDMLDVLEERLANFDGTLILISHDRDFIDRLVTSTISFDPDGQVREYAGGYTDMMRQRGEGNYDEYTQSSPPLKTADKPKIRKPKKGLVRKLSYNDQRALDMLPGEIEATEAMIAELEKRLGDPDLYGRGHEMVTDLAVQLENAKSQLEEMHNRWLHLEEQKEALEVLRP